MTVYRRNPSVLWRRVGSQIILAPADRDDFSRLSETGAQAWLLLESPMSDEDLTAGLASLYDIPAQQISAPVDALLEQLRDLRAVEVV